MLGAIQEENNHAQHSIDTETTWRASANHLARPALRQLRRECEARELKANGQTAVYFGNFWSNALLWDQASWLVKNWPKIDGFVSGSAQGTIGEIQQNGRARIVQL